MCWCEDFEFTINRADEYMIKEKWRGGWYVISPPDIMALVLKAVERGDAHIPFAAWAKDDEPYRRVQLSERMQEWYIEEHFHES